MPWNELKMLRESAGLSQEALAKKISISQSALGNYERGTRAPDKEIVVKLANFFDVSCDFLLGVSKDRRREMNLADLTGLSDFTIDFMKQLPYGVKTEIDAIIKKKPELLRWLLYTIADLSRAAKTFSKERVGTVELDPETVSSVTIPVLEAAQDANKKFETTGSSACLAVLSGEAVFQYSLYQAQQHFTYLLTKALNVSPDLFHKSLDDLAVSDLDTANQSGTRE